MRLFHHRGIALFLAVTFSFTQIADAGLMAPTAASGVSFQLEIPARLDLEIPSRLGHLEAGKVQSGPTIVHVLTAHGNYESQKKIQSILQHLHDRYGLKTLLVEGSASRLEASKLNYFPHHPKATEAVQEELLRKGILKGAELFLFQNADTRAYGIEDLKDYERNAALFRSVMAESAFAADWLASLRVRLSKLEGRMFSSELRRYLRRQEDFSKGSLPIENLLETIESSGKKQLGMDLTNPRHQLDWPMLTRYFKIKELAATFDGQTFEAEKPIFLKAVKQKKIRRLMQHYFSPKLNWTKLRDPEVTADFARLAESLPENYDWQKFPQIRNESARLMLQSELEPKRLSAEAEEISAQIAESLADTNTVRDLLKLRGTLKDLEQLFDLELDPKDYARLVRSRPSALGFMNQLGQMEQGTGNGRRGTGDRAQDTCADSARIEALIYKSLEFYRAAKLRDGKMMKNIQGILRKTGETQVVLITGGFHAAALESMIVKSQMSYARILPLVNKLDARTERKERESYIRTISESASQPKTTASESADRSTLEAKYVTDAAVKLGAGIRSEIRQAIERQRGLYGISEERRTRDEGRRTKAENQRSEMREERGYGVQETGNSVQELKTKQGPLQDFRSRFTLSASRFNFFASRFISLLAAIFGFIQPTTHADPMTPMMGIQSNSNSVDVSLVSPRGLILNVMTSGPNGVGDWNLVKQLGADYAGRWMTNVAKSSGHGFFKTELAGLAYQDITENPIGLAVTDISDPALNLGSVSLERKADGSIHLVTETAAGSNPTGVVPIRIVGPFNMSEFNTLVMEYEVVSGPDTFSIFESYLELPQSVGGGKAGAFYGWRKLAPGVMAFDYRGAAHIGQADALELRLLMRSGGIKITRMELTGNPLTHSTDNMLGLGEFVGKGTKIDYGMKVRGTENPVRNRIVSVNALPNVDPVVVEYDQAESGGVITLMMRGLNWSAPELANEISLTFGGSGVGILSGRLAHLDFYIENAQGQLEWYSSEEGVMSLEGTSVRIHSDSIGILKDIKAIDIALFVGTKGTKSGRFSLKNFSVSVVPLNSHDSLVYPDRRPAGAGAAVAVSSNTNSVNPSVSSPRSEVRERVQGTGSRVQDLKNRRGALEDFRSRFTLPDSRVLPFIKELRAGFDRPSAARTRLLAQRKTVAQETLGAIFVPSIDLDFVAKNLLLRKQLIQWLQSVNIRGSKKIATVESSVSLSWPKDFREVLDIRIPDSDEKESLVQNRLASDYFSGARFAVSRSGLGSLHPFVADIDLSAMSVEDFHVFFIPVLMRASLLSVMIQKQIPKAVLDKENNALLSSLVQRLFPGFEIFGNRIRLSRIEEFAQALQATERFSAAA